MRKSNVLDNAFVSSVQFAQLGARSREKAGVEDDQDDCSRQEAEWVVKMNKAFERGLAQGEAHAGEKLQLLVQALGKARGDLEAEAEKQAVHLAIKLAQTVMRTQVLFDNSALEAALDEALQRVSASSILRVRGNP